MKRTYNLFFIILMIFSCFSCNETDSWQSSLSGTVIDSANGDEVGEVKLTFVPGNYTITSSDNGSFFIEDLPAGVYTVTTSKEGYVATDNTLKITSSSSQNITFEITNEQTEFSVADANFKIYLLDNFDENKDDILIYKEVMNIEEIDCSSKNITNISEISAMRYLKRFICNNNIKLELLPIEKNRLVEELQCTSTAIYALSILKVDSLRSLDISGTKIDNIDLSKNIALTSFSANKTKKLTTLKFTYNTRLQTLSCFDSNVSSLDVSKCTDLVELRCDTSLVSSLSLSNAKKIERLHCSNTPISSLSLSSNELLKELNCSKTEIYRLDISNNSLLEKLDCSYTRLTNINLTQNSVLKEINVTGIPNESGNLRITIKADQQSSITIIGNNNYDIIIQEEQTTES